MLGTLEKMELRTVWQTEDRHFTPWLAESDNIARLSEAIELDLEVIAQEEQVGPFRADILCRDTVNEHYVLIENQFENTDHKHLGQLMTYAAGLSAVTIVWIAERFTDEHRAALDWLNRITDDSVDFFGIEIEVYRIGDSLPAPNFKIVSKPNNWSKNIKRTAESSQITETKLRQQEYWQALKNYVESRHVSFKMQKPLPQHWTNIPIGRSYFHLSAFTNTRDQRIAVGLIVDGPAALENFNKLRSQFEEGSRVHIDPAIEWKEKEGGKEHHVMVRKHGVNPLDEADWAHQHEWLLQTIEKFIVYFREKIKSLNS